ncbi:SusC/RagA family TonB-linked outer membrane protein [uncultured Parabacteroides sp.]|uniref:SusC/RagA family TonB-linked outer membrane protein n=1 Tax=uncultured Parabacteroides sp. TaxID=512312 RepID=UPI0025D8136A|nr:TonB-dependent receptor [uncultured Parabacteroides sp.]
MLKIARPVSLMLMSAALLATGTALASDAESATPKVGISQQQTSLKGVVNDSFGPVVGASVVVKGTTNGMVTDMDGNFVLENVKNGDIIQISYIGYITQEIKYTGQATITVNLKEDTQALDEVVVIGYGTVKKSDLTGAVSQVKMDDEPIATVGSVSQVLAGKAAGLQANTVSAQPGGGTSFRIRGAASPSAGNDPLIIVDGFPVSDPGNMDVGKYNDGTKDNVLASINPNDIESIEVLKDASSTAIYGARAGNGVIIVTTKKGKSGKPNVKYSGSVSTQKLASNYEVLDASDWMSVRNSYYKEKWMRENKIGVYGGVDPSTVSPFVPKYSDADIANPVNNTDWMDGVTRNGFQTQHNVSISGGSEYTKYLVSGNYFKQNGVLENNGLTRFTGRVNLEQKLSKYVKTGINLTLSTNNYDNVPLGNGHAENASMLVAASQFNPLIAVKDANGDYCLNPEAAFMPNPISMLEITDKTRKKRILGTAFLEIEPIKDLILKANVGIDNNMQKRRTYLPTTTLYGAKEGGKADIGEFDKNDYLLELTAAYRKDIGKHSINGVVGYSFQSFNYESLYAGNSQFITDGFLYNNLGAGAYPKPSVGSSASKTEMASFFGRIGYTYAGKYLLTATLRADGASNFADNNRWGYFPSVALGWRFSEEAFMQNLQDVISNGKLRVSVGQTGNSNIGNKAISYYQVGNNNIFGGTEHKGVYLKQMGNPDLSWETTSEVNVGLDLGFINNRINVTAEYFYKVVSDLLDYRSLLSYQEVDKIAANIGETQSTGFELTINTRNFQQKDFTWNTDFTFSLYRDKWKDRGPYWKPSAYSFYDAPLRGWYGYLSDGLVQPGEEIAHMKGAIPGQVKLKDIDGYAYNEDGTMKVDKYGIPVKSGKPDGILNDADKVFYGCTDPGFMLGLNNTFTYKDFDLSFYFYGQFNMLNAGSYKDTWLTGDGQMNIDRLGTGYNMPVSVKEVWSNDNPNGTRPGYFQPQSSWGIGDYYVDKTWFIRCRNITLGYTLPKTLGKGLFSNLRVYADINNPFVITPYDGLDPETDNSNYAYPNVRSFSFGVDISF